jgi:3-oxoacyl-[acyl-carrier-protein] synthase-3
MKEVYITSAGTFLPNKPISNLEIEDYLGCINGKPSSVKDRILNTTHLNAELAAEAIHTALAKSTLSGKDIQLLATGTTQGDLPIPGFASMVHAQLDFSTCELASFQSVCASGIMALKDSFAQLKSGEKENAVCVGSELASRLFKASRFEAQKLTSIPFDTEFLRWMLSDGAGAFVLQDKANSSGVSLKIDWIDLQSHAHQFPLCMYTGKNSNKDEKEKTWLDYPDYSAAAEVGAINLKQDIRLLQQVVQTGVAHYFSLIDKGRIQVPDIDWLCCHYSSEYFKPPIKELMIKGGGAIADEKWFSNLTTKGNTGAASIFIMLEELMYSDKLKNGDTILCMVPESGRFITSFMQLKVVKKEVSSQKSYPIRAVSAPALNIDGGELSQWLVRQLSQIWIGFERDLQQVPIIQKIHAGTLKIEDYELLLHDLRQQVIDGSQWISRAASNIDIELFELRSAFIKHTAAEHKDYQMLEKNFQNLGMPIERIQSGEKNIGSVALSAFMFQQASQANPIDLLGAMFIIEGIGKRLAAYWGEMIQDQLKLKNEQVSFFTYHGVADEKHFQNLERALEHPFMHEALAKKIVKTAKTTAYLYKMQLEELGNY